MKSIGVLFLVVFSMIGIAFAQYVAVDKQHVQQTSTHIVSVNQICEQANIVAQRAAMLENECLNAESAVNAYTGK